MTRPPVALRYFGAKHALAEQLIALFPAHSIYVEPFGGSAAVMAAKPPARVDVYNDVDSVVVNFFRVLREQPDELAAALWATPYSREEFDAARIGVADSSLPAIERARMFVVTVNQGRSAIGRSTGWRRMTSTPGARVAVEWAGRLPALLALAERMRAVQIEHRPWDEVLADYDGPDTLTYLDPPYPRQVRRTDGKSYRCEMLETDEHVALLDRVQGCEGAVVLSGYACDLYDDALADWHRVEIGGREVVWMNREPRAQLSLIARSAQR